MNKKTVEFNIKGTYEIDLDEGDSLEKEQEHYNLGRFDTDDLIGAADEDSFKVTFKYVEEKTARDAAVDDIKNVRLRDLTGE